MTTHRENPAHPIVAVGVVVVRADEVLLIKRGKAPKAGEWSLPGGAVHLGETTQAAAKREILEETSLEIEPDRLLDVVDYIDHSEDGTVRFHYTLIDFVALYEGKDPIAGSDAEDARFFPIDEALALPLWSETKRILRLAINTAHAIRKDRTDAI